MKTLKDMLIEAQVCENKVEELEKKLDKVEDKADKAKEDADKAKEDADKAKEDADKAKKESEKAEESIKDEKDFREYAEKKFKDVFGDKLDEKQMKDVIDGILKDCKDEIEKGEFGSAIGMLNKSFGK